MTDKVEEIEKLNTPAANALFQLQFMSIMASCGRHEMAEEAYLKAQKILMEIVEKEDKEREGGD